MGRPIELTGVRWDLNAQLAWLDSMCTPYVDEVRGLAEWRGRGRDRDRGPELGPIESQVLHSVVRSLAPAPFVEVCSLVAEANPASAQDNVTVFVVQVERASGEEEAISAEEATTLTTGTSHAQDRGPDL